MKTILFRYIFRQLALAMLLTSLAVTLVIWLTQAMRIMELVLDRGAPVSLFLWMLFLTLPTFLNVVIPVGLALAVLFVYYRLILENELVVMKSAGLTPLSLAKPVLVLSLLVALFSYGLNIWLSPWANRELVRNEYAVKNDYSLLLLRDGAFNKVGEGLTVYVRERGSDNVLRGLLLHDNRNPERPITLTSAMGAVLEGKGKPLVILFNGKRQELVRETGQMTELDFSQYVIDLSAYGDKLENRWVEPRERSMTDLFNPKGVIDLEPITLGRLVAERHQRLATPFFAVSFALLALAFVLNAPFSRRGMVGRLVLAMVCVVLLQAASLGVINIIPKQHVFIYLLYALVLVPIPLFLLWIKGRGGRMT